MIGAVEAGQDFALGFVVQHHIATHDLAGREIAVLDALNDVVGVYRFSEVADVVGEDALVLPSLFRVLGDLQRPRRGG